MKILIIGGGFFFFFIHQINPAFHLRIVAID